MKNRRREGQLADCLIGLGAKRVEALLVSCLASQAPLATEEVVKRTGLRQPEVSVGMRTLRERDWVESEPIPREGKGRPMHRYMLAVDPSQIYEHYAQAAQEQIASLQESLRELASTLPAGAADADAVGMGHERSAAEA